MSKNLEAGQAERGSILGPNARSVHRYGLGNNRAIGLWMTRSDVTSGCGKRRMRDPSLSLKSCSARYNARSIEKETRTLTRPGLFLLVNPRLEDELRTELHCTRPVGTGRLQERRTT